jgi:hypothetical protein
MRKLRHQIKRRFSIAAPRLAVHPHLPWYVRWSLAVPLVLLAGWLVWWAYGSGLELAGFHREQAEDELSSLKRQVADLRDENVKLNTKLVDYERQFQMEHAANTEMERQLKTLNDEKGHLDEDLAFYQNLTQSASREENLSIQRLKIVHDTLPGEYHCSMLLVQSGQRPKDFLGNVQLVLNIRRGGEKSVVLFPQPDSQDAAAYRLDFKYYHRMERSFRLPPDAVLESLQVRVYEQGVKDPKAKQDAALS